MHRQGGAPSPIAALEVGLDAAAEGDPRQALRSSIARAELGDDRVEIGKGGGRGDAAEIEPGAQPLDMRREPEGPPAGHAQGLEETVAAQEAGVAGRHHGIVAKNAVDEGDQGSTSSSMPAPSSATPPAMISSAAP